MSFRRCSCLLLGCLLLVSFCLIFASAGSGGEQRSAILVTASDFQGGAAFDQFSRMLDCMTEDGYAVPDGVLFGGDYGEDLDTDSDSSAEVLLSLLRGKYGDYPRQSVTMIRGNHDGKSDALNATGLYVHEEYLVYVIDYDDFPEGQYWRQNAAALVRQTADALEAALADLVKQGESRPVFVLSHIPLHHSGRAKYGENLYSKYIFDVLNEMGNHLDLIFLFGHDHSGDYDNYIGGSVNFLGRGESVRIPIAATLYQGEAGYTNETLQFTYANYGYVGYTNNSVNEVSTNVLTAGLWEIRPTTIQLFRYTLNGKYSTQVIQRRNPAVNSAYVCLDGDRTFSAGSICTVTASVGNLAAPHYEWSVADPSLVELSAFENRLQLTFRKAGSTTLSVKVTDLDGKTVSDSVQLTVTEAQTAEPWAEVYTQGQKVSGRQLYFYQAAAGGQIKLEGLAQGFSPALLKGTWSSSDERIAAVEAGVVTLHGSGSVEITFTAEDGSQSLSRSVQLVLSQEPKPTFVLTEREGGLYGSVDGTPLTGWHSLLNQDGSVSTYYFDPATGRAADGTCLIDGHSYVFSQCVLRLGEFCRDENGICYYWAGALVKNRWFQVEDRSYFAQNNGYLATGLQWVLSPQGDDYAGFVFDENGVFCRNLSGLYHEGGDTYYVAQGVLVQEAGLVYAEGSYYFFPGSSKAVKNTGYWIYKTNGIMPEGFYYFDSYGRMLDAPEIYHEITWVVDGIRTTQSVRSGDFPRYLDGQEPTKETTAEYRYVFAGWSPECSIAIADIEYTACFTAIAHSWQTITQEPTCYEDGLETVVCESCGYVLSRKALLSKGHNYVAVRTYPNCTEGGYCTYDCAACGEQYVSDYVLPTGHINLYSVTVEPTCTEYGTATILCICGKVMDVRETKPTGHSFAYENQGADHLVTCTRGCGSSYPEAHSYANGSCRCGAVPAQRRIRPLPPPDFRRKLRCVIK